MASRRIAAPILAGIVAIVAASAAHLWLEIDRGLRIAPHLRRGPESIARGHEIITTAESLRRAMMDLERGQRGFLLTGNAAYLDAYRKGESEAPALLQQLRKLTAENAEQQRRWPILEQQVNVKLGELRRTLAIFEQRGLEAARQIILANVGQDAMQGVNTALDAAIAAERELLDEDLARAKEIEREGRAAALFGGALQLLVLLLGIGLVVYGFRVMSRLVTATQASEDRFRIFVGGVTDYAIYTLDPQGRVMEWNAGARRIKGYAADEIIGQSFERFYTEDDRAAGIPASNLRKAAETGRFEVEAWRVRKDGSRFYASVVIDAIHDDSGRLIGFAKVTRDIGERVQHQQALLQYQKMDALGQLTGGIAHDFNNLLHVMRNAVEILERSLKDAGPNVKSYLDMLRRNAERATSLTQRLLAFSRRQVLDPRPINPNALIVDVTTLLEQILGEGIEIETVLGAGVWWTSIDPTQLETALLNLAINARDAMSGGGKLTVETSNALLDENYAAAHLEVTPGQYVMIAMSDTGSGMTREVMSKAFDPFFTTKEVGRGTGLGLSQVYGFVKQSGGHAKLYSEPGEGTSVKLYFPRHVGALPEHPAEEPATVPLPRGRGTVLVVEDEDDVARFTAELLGALGYRVLTARDAAAALKILEAGAVDLLFTDIGLPGGTNGRQLADQAVQRWPALKVLFTTGYTRNAIVHHGRLDPDVSVILKPFTQASLAAAVKAAMGGEP